MIGEYLLWEPRKPRASISDREKEPEGPDLAGSGLRRLLAGVPFFKGIDEAALDELRLLGRLKRAAQGGYFFHQGEDAEYLYVLLEGKVRLIQISAEGQNVPLHIVQPGEPFGGGAVLGHHVYPAGSEALVASEALCWDSATIGRLLDRHPRLVRNILQVVAARFAELQDRFRELATERVERRVARALIRLSGPHGKTTDRGTLIDLPLSRQDLAEMAGTTLSTVSRLISRWEGEGVVETGRGWILVRQPDRLVAIAEELPESPGES